MHKQSNNAKASNIIRVSIDNQSIKARGFYFDAKGNNYGFNKSFNSEESMHNEFESMRERDCDIQIVIERNQSKVNWS
jgi:hypothetical protein